MMVVYDQEDDFELWSQEFDADAWMAFFQHRAMAEANERR